MCFMSGAGVAARVVLSVQTRLACTRPSGANPVSSHASAWPHRWHTWSADDLPAVRLLGRGAADHGGSDVPHAHRRCTRGAPCAGLVRCRGTRCDTRVRRGGTHARRTAAASRPPTPPPARRGSSRSDSIARTIRPPARRRRDLHASPPRPRSFVRLRLGRRTTRWRDRGRARRTGEARARVANERRVRGRLRRAARTERGNADVVGVARRASEDGGRSRRGVCPSGRAP